MRLTVGHALLLSVLLASEAGCFAVASFDEEAREARKGSASPATGGAAGAGTGSGGAPSASGGAQSAAGGAPGTGQAGKSGGVAGQGGTGSGGLAGQAGGGAGTGEGGAKSGDAGAAGQGGGKGGDPGAGGSSGGGDGGAASGGKGGAGEAGAGQAGSAGMGQAGMGQAGMGQAGMGQAGQAGASGAAGAGASAGQAGAGGQGQGGQTAKACAGDAECVDDDACTVDACDSSGFCANTPTPVDDGLDCTLDACDPVAGVTHTPPSSGPICGDSCPNGFYPIAIDVSEPACGANPATMCKPTCLLSEYTACGSLCEDNFHPEQRLCTDSLPAMGKLSCGGCAVVPNAVRCFKTVTGEAFGQCGAECPAGYHISEVGCGTLTKTTLDCGACPKTMTDTVPSAVRCEPNVGTFTMCGPACPKGWVATAPVCTSACTVGTTCLEAIECSPSGGP